MHASIVNTYMHASSIHTYVQPKCMDILQYTVVRASPCCFLTLIPQAQTLIISDCDG